MENVLKSFEILWAAIATYAASDFVMKIIARWDKLSPEGVLEWINLLMHLKTLNLPGIEVLYSIAIFYLALSVTILTRKIRQEIEWR